MIPELKDVSSVDWDGKTPVPRGSCIWLHLEIGDSQEASADLFQIGVCDEEWRDLNIGDLSKGFSLGDVHFAAEAILLLDSIDMDRIRKAVSSILKQMGPFDEWSDFGRAMKGIAMWEFEEAQR